MKKACPEGQAPLAGQETKLPGRVLVDPYLTIGIYKYREVPGKVPACSVPRLSNRFAGG